MQRLLSSPWDDLIHPVIVIIEDSDEDFYSFWRAIQKLNLLEKSPYNFLRFQDGDEALDYLFRQGEYQELKAPIPVAILLDLNLPNTDGRDIIKMVKQSPDLQIIPIIVLTTSNSLQDIQTCYKYSANCYMLKPMGVKEMQQTVQVIFQNWFQLAVLPSYGQFIT
ncbi:MULTISPECIES: response regulator [Planktothrix]|uniref:response regulator n=1 Tax=Planktothrix TaxID=54304 RepID=UPI000400AB80|nr:MULTISPECIES: response regulator [Planktothrix]CAD0228394.1 Response regulator receiver protein [Planktothrix agardhii]